jgi:hypothetical protein
VSRRHPLRAALASFALVAVSCSTDPVGPPGTPEPSFVLTPASGGGQTGRADRPLASPLRVAVTRDGAPAAGVPVVWYTEDGIVQPSGVTDAQGIATAAWTLPRRAGPVNATARIDGAAAVPAHFRAEAWFPEIEKVSGDRQTGVVGETLPEPFQVRVTRHGVPLAGEPVRWSFLPDPVLTGPDGIASAVFPVGGLAGFRVATVKIDLLMSPSTYFTATATPGPLASVRIEPIRVIWGGSATYWSQGIPLDFSVTAYDSHGNALKDVPIAWSITGGSGTLGATVVTGLEGRVAVRVTPEEGYRGEIAVRAAADGIEPASLPYRYTHFMILDGDGWGDYLDRSSVNVERGEVVRWVNEGLETHALAPATVSEAATVLLPGATFERAFTADGSHEWICTHHDWEKFTITVAP